MLHQKGIVAGLFIILLAFVCAILGVQAYIPQHKVAMAFERIFSTFEASVTLTIIALAIAIIVVVATVTLAVPVAAGLAGWAGFSHGLIWWFEARLRRATAKKAEVKAGLILTNVPAGNTLFASEVQGWLPIQHRPLSLAPGRVNGSEIIHTTEEKNRWAFFHLVHSTAKRDSALEMPAIGPGYPPSVNLMDLLPNGSSFHNVVLGLHIAEDGSQQIISDSMQNLVHVAIGGSSGWGKSVALRSLAYQMATCDEPTKLCFIDSEDLTFTPFKSSDRLLYPVADNDADSLAIVGELSAEMGRRKVLYAQFPTVEKLSDYNRHADEPLPYIMLFADEITSLLQTNKVLAQMLTLQILRARKYGIMAILGGQSWKASEVDTTTRGQFSSTIHFHARDKSSSTVLLGSGIAADITQRGVAFAVLPGRPMIEFLSPNISLASAMREIGGTGPTQVEMPTLPEPEPDQLERAILDRAANGESYNKIAMDLLGSRGGHQTSKIKDILAKFE